MLARTALRRTRICCRPLAANSPSNKIYPSSWVHYEPHEFIGKTGGEIFHEMMRRHGVKHIFGYPGGAILPVFDAIYQSPHLEFILPRHEQGGGHMAEGYARASGKPGVVVVTSGPGATNTITPMQDALCDGTPMIVFTGQVPTSAIGTDAFQEADVVGLSRSCTKWNVLVKKLEDLPQRINEAFHIATSGRPGPVLVDLPKDVTASVLKKPISNEVSLPAFRKLAFQSQHSDQSDVEGALERIAHLINESQKPVLYVGQGVIQSGAHELIAALSQIADIPVTTSLQGLGAFDELNPLSLHMLGMHGSVYANRSMQEADLIIAVGARFDDRVTGNLTKFAPEARRAEAESRGGIIHFDILPKNINKVVPVTEYVGGDCGPNLRSLLPMIKRKKRAPWIAQINQWKDQYPFRYAPQDPQRKMKPQRVIEELDRQTREIKDKVIITTGVGQHQMWAAQYFRWRHPNTFITSGGLGTMGYGLPAAIGAQVARPDCIVVDIDGDGSLCMTGNEMITAAEFGIPVKVLLLNNDFQGMVKQWQDLFYEERYSSTRMKNPDFVKWAEAMNCRALRVRTEEELPQVMKEFLECKEPVLLDAVVDAAEHVYPMVPAGKGLHEMVIGDCVKPQ